MRERLIGALPVALAYVLLAAVLLIAGEYLLPVRVVGGSMEPALYSGDVVLVRRNARPVPGDVVLSTPPSSAAVLHRVVGFDVGGRVRLRGDANAIEDLAPVDLEHVAGKAVVVVPLGRLMRGWRAN